ncbi:MAG TPA: hypothetical protein VM187_01145, partial [Niastella sp.]|nr:hypothetical protein [Niastella sp.]
QESIKAAFYGYGFQGLPSVGSIKISKHNGSYYTFENKSLALLKIFDLGRCPAKIYTVRIK